MDNAQQFLQDAVNRELLTRNPFSGLEGTVHVIKRYRAENSNLRTQLKRLISQGWRFALAQAIPKPTG